MSSSTEKACKLIKYIVEACPATLETKNTAGNTPLMVACWFGRTEFIKILLEAGADQSVRNKGGYNILHNLLAGKPKEAQLRPVLELLDDELCQHHFMTRTNLQENGTTPLHSFVTAVTATRSSYRSDDKYKNDEEWQEVLKLLLEFSGGAELEMLNSAGDTCLHTAVMTASAPMVRALVDFRPQLLYRENAVGRTPAEVARDRVTASKFMPPGPISIPNGTRLISTLIEKPTSKFLEVPSKQGEVSAAMKVWQIMLEAMEKFPDKRRLVSLTEANDVAKRLSETYNASRYFTIQARDDDEDKEEDVKDQADFSATQMLASTDRWACVKCHKRHGIDDSL
jgi:hypothetical protein